jgi:hypothetical protein
MDEGSLGALTRRHLLAASALAMVGTAATGARGTGLALAAPTPTPPARLPASLRNAEMAEWQQVVGASFRLSGGGRVRLVAVEALPAPGPRPQGIRAQAFAAVFETAAGAVEDDRTYRLSNLMLPPVDVHFGPKIRAGAQVRHIAVFN